MNYCWYLRTFYKVTPDGEKYYLEKVKKNLIIVENSNKKPKTIPSNFKKVFVYLFLIKYKFNYVRLICFFLYL
jgi:hypothetical protein